MKYLVYFETGKFYSDIDRSADLFKYLFKNYELLKFEPQWSNHDEETFEEQMEKPHVDGLFFYNEDKLKSTRLILEELVKEIRIYCYLETMYLINFEEAIKVYKNLYLKEVLENLKENLWNIHEVYNKDIHNQRFVSKNLDDIFFEDWNSTEYENLRNSSNKDGTIDFNNYRLKQSKILTNNSLGFYSWVFSNRKYLLSYVEDNVDFIVEFYS